MDELNNLFGSRLSISLRVAPCPIQNQAAKSKLTFSACHITVTNPSHSRNELVIF